jgi:hypothetical protein
VSFPGKLHPPSDPRGDGGFVLEFGWVCFFVIRIRILCIMHVSIVSCMYLACIVHVFCMYLDVSHDREGKLINMND